MIMWAGTKKRRAAHVLLFCSAVLCGPTHTHKNGVTMRLLSLVDKPETGGMNEEERERQGDGLRWEMDEERSRKER